MPSILPRVALVGLFAIHAATSACFSADEPTFTRTVQVRTAYQLKPALANARPGDDIVIAKGVYPGAMYFTVVGTKERPIRIRGANAAAAPVIRGGQVGLQLSSSHSVTLQDLILEGGTQNGLSLDDGGKLDQPATEIDLIRVVVRKVGAGGNEDGIKLSGLQHFRVTDCKLEGWGGGGQGIDMVGCRNGKITGCTFNGLGTSQLGLQAKGGSRDIVVERCTFRDIRERGLQIGGSTGKQFFRPSLQPFEAKDITVRDSFFCGCGAGITFVNADGAVVERNILYQPRMWAFRILQESTGPEFTPCRNAKITDNAIVWNTKEWRTAINVGGGTAAQTFQFARNTWYCEDQPARSRPDSLPVAEQDGVYGKDPHVSATKDCELKLADGQ